MTEDRLTLTGTVNGAYFRTSSHQQTVSLPILFAIKSV